MDVLEYQTADGARPFSSWFDELDPWAAAKIRTAMARIELGNLSNAKGVGSGVMEYRIDAGPGYRVYFGQDGAALVILLAGGTKRLQQRDIETAHDRWNDYKRRKKGGD